MAYIGREPTVGNFQVCDAISVVNGQAAYTMQVSSVNVLPESENHMLVSLNGILQRPGSSFTVSGSTITFASNLVTGDVINFIHILGSVLDLGVPSDSTVSLAKLTATGTKDATTFLRGDNTFAAAGGGKINQVVQAVKTDTFTCTSASFTDVTGITVNITPSATSSKVLVMASLVGGAANEIHVHFKLLRGSTDILKGDAASNRIRATTSTGPIRNTSQSENFSIQYLDSPSSTSQQTYKIQMQNQGSSQTSYINRSGADVDNSTFSRNTSTITVMEVLA
jgi:hypothetical protein